MKPVEEKTLKLHLPEPSASTRTTLAEKSSWAKVFTGSTLMRLWIKTRRVAWIYALASVLAAYLVGTRIYREPHQPALLPEATLLSTTSITPVAKKSETPPRSSLPQAVKKTLMIHSAEHPESLLRCRMELGSPRFATESENPFPQCENLLAIELRSGECSRIRQEFAETIYLLAYAFAQENTEKAGIWAEISLRASGGCAANLAELRKRTLELQRKIKSRSKATVGLRV